MYVFICKEHLKKWTSKYIWCNCLYKISFIRVRAYLLIESDHYNYFTTMF